MTLSLRKFLGDLEGAPKSVDRLSVTKKGGQNINDGLTTNSEPTFEAELENHGHFSRICTDCLESSDLGFFW